MATTYKTPGVYIEEISKFPPSIAQVETAIPAFIGYTEKATDKVKGDLSEVPTRITSMLEYETYFGKAKSETTIKVTITDTTSGGSTNRAILVEQPTSKQPFLMYYSLQMYFANGGGPCYIVSVDQFGSEKTSPAISVSLSDLQTGLGKIKKVDEPTLILFPDATSLSTDTDFYAIYNDALKQCKNLQDRFTIIDTYSDEKHDTGLSDSGGSPYGTLDPDKAIREGINLEKDYIKYGAVYYPFIETILDYQFSEDTTVVTHYSDDASAYALIKNNMATLEAGVPALIEALYKFATGTISGDVSDVLLHMYDSTTGFDLGGTFSTDATKKTKLMTLVKTLNDSLKALIDAKDKIDTEANAAASTIADEDPAIKTSIESALSDFNKLFEDTDKIESVYANLKSLYDKMNDADTDTKVKNLLMVNAINFDKELKKLANYTPLNSLTGVTVSSNAFDTIVTKLTALSTEIKKVEGKDLNNGELNGRNLEAVALADNSTYNKILTEIKNLPMKLPSSCTMAGVYARVDKDRGVWKAPANVGLNYVIKPSQPVTHEEQQDLNVDATAGKSINAIRSFTGKGTLVWGARTLAGNDKEWRYISVRRFFNMVEESVKKATAQFVFEPNDANTWIKVKAMIENFLTLQWRAGALAGPAPDKAFYVKVGLGETMTANDILDGFMIIEIGMAAVRPAEFIVLKFSHKMQEA